MPNWHFLHWLILLYPKIENFNEDIKNINHNIDNNYNYIINRGKENKENKEIKIEENNKITNNNEIKINKNNDNINDDKNIKIIRVINIDIDEIIIQYKLNNIKL